MQTEHVSNRVEADLNQWKQKEERFSQLFSFNVTSNRDFLKEKLQYYNRIAAKYKNSDNPEEKLAIRILKQEQNRIEKQLYPNLWLRLLRKLNVEPIQQKYIAQKEEKQIVQNTEALKNLIHKAGFGQVTSQLEESIKQGLPEFKIPVSYYVSEKERMNFQLTFHKDKNGQYQFENYQAILQSDNKSVQNRQQTFRPDNTTSITANQAYNLLSGRALQVEASQLEAKQGKWVQLDFTDKDAMGNYRMKEFRADYGYDLKQVLKELPLEQKQNQQLMDKLFKELVNGNRQMVFLHKGNLEQKYFIEANPQQKSITLYDAQMKKVSLSSVLEQKNEKRETQAAQIAKTIQLQPGKAKRNGLSLG
ncbi:hypothetical protein [Xanthocytophaga agilis]|uniref:Uncharacterized protein n=1 Tax=Xanthocytophaga agilis TaxID=3048010 RepID=A0AAE3RA50_9BACT|nr:hypothetical protein [Xanthocytophaga agilis]MDJ1503587.1 hypothetical protein [Xanthocytophaga agilis]